MTGSKSGLFSQSPGLQNRVKSYNSGLSVGQGLMDFDRRGALFQTCRNELMNDERMGTPMSLNMARNAG